MKVVELDDGDLLVFSNPTDDPLLVWCATTKFNKSCALKSVKDERTYLLLNLRNLFSSAWGNYSEEEVLTGTIVFLNYLVLHELCHWAGADDLPEEIWDRFIINLLIELGE